MTRLTIRVDFDDGRHLGHGKVRLLEMVDAHGSISSAARAMDMSYRRAWLLADEVNRMFRTPVLETQLGGKGGGHARLTEFGRLLVDHYRSIERESKAAFAPRIAALEDQLAPVPDEQPEAQG
ncbi:MAG: winged helix-turn-helix domain-containing protein [Beijerinckiaceae bacterium]|nr:winged helix-turn-helix domain-containing protein [Beijerinckiaceae bacterium]